MKWSAHNSKRPEKSCRSGKRISHTANAWLYPQNGKFSFRVPKMVGLHEAQANCFLMSLRAASSEKSTWRIWFQLPYSEFWFCLENRARLMLWLKGSEKVIQRAEEPMLPNSVDARGITRGSGTRGSDVAMLWRCLGALPEEEAVMEAVMEGSLLQRRSVTAQS